MNWRPLQFTETITQKRTALLTLILSFGLGCISHILLVDAQSDRITFWYVPDWWRNFAANRSPLLGLFFTVFAGVIFVYGITRLGKSDDKFRFIPQEASAKKPRFGFWLTSLGLSTLAAASVTYTYGEKPSGYFSLVIWAIAITLGVVSVLISNEWHPPSLDSMITWINNNRNELLLIGMIFLVALIVRTYNLELYPYSFINDEGEMGKAASCILGKNCSGFFQVIWAGQPLIAMLPTAISIKLLGVNAFAVRLPMAILGTLAVLTTYLFVRETIDQRTAWVTAALMAILPVHVHFSRLGVDNLVDSFFSSALIWLIYYGAKHNNRIAYAFAGLIGGLTIYTYPGARLSLALGLGTLIYLSLRTKRYLATHSNYLAVFFFILIVTMMPIGVYFAQHPENFMARLVGENIFRNGIVENEIKQPNQNLVTVLTKQFLRSSLVYFATPAEEGFFMSPRAYLAPLAGIFFILGLTLVTWKIADPRFMTIFAWFWAAIILGSTITSGPPSSERMLNSIPALAIITAIGLVKFAEIFATLGSLAHRIIPILIIGTTLFINYQDYNFYFIEYAQKHAWENSTNELTYESRLEIQPLGQQGHFYLIGEPLVYIVFGNFSFFSPNVDKADFNDVTPEALAALPKDKDVLFIAIPHRLPDLKKLADWIPGGTWKETYRRYQPDQVLYYSYKISKEQLASFKP